MYHVGGGTHPGAGIPGVLLGAEITAALIADDIAEGRLGTGREAGSRATSHG
jgi:phytoene desaturase